MSFFDYYTSALALMEDPETSSQGLASIYGGSVGQSTALGGISAVAQQDAIPDYTFIRGRVPINYDEERRPGSRGRRYFTDYGYADLGAEGAYMDAVNAQAAALSAANQANVSPNTAFTAPSYDQQSLVQTGEAASNVSNYVPVPSPESIVATPMYAGGLAALAKGGKTPSQGYYLGGQTDGMADKIPARIDGVQEARLSDGEFVVPADVVSHLGNGNSNAGAKQLYSMMDRVRKARTGREEQGRQIDPSNYMPKQG